MIKTWIFVETHNTLSKPFLLKEYEMKTNASILQALCKSRRIGMEISK